MTMRHRLIALFVAVVFILGTVYVPETAFAQMQEEVPVAEAPGETRVISEEVSSEEAAAEAEDSASEAAASGDSEEEQEKEIRLTPIKGQKQEDLLKPIGGNTPTEDDLVQDASGDQVAQALGEEGNELPAAYTENLGKAKIRDQGLTALCWAFSAATIAELNRGNTTGDYTSYSPVHLGYFFYNRVNDPLGNTAGDRNSIAYSGESYASLGGSMVYGFQAMANWSGMAEETSYPYSSYISGSIPKASVKIAEADGTVSGPVLQELFDYSIDSGWVQISKQEGTDNNTYVYAYAANGKCVSLAADASTPVLFKNGEIKFRNVVEGQLGSDVTIPVTAYGIQTENLGSNGSTAPADVWAVLSGQISE